MEMSFDCEILMPDREFSETHNVDKATELGLIYLNTLFPDPETGLVPYEMEPGGMSPELSSFIATNKENSKLTKIHGMDKELDRAYKLQRVINAFLLNKNTGEGRRVRLLEENIDRLSIRIPRSSSLEGLDIKSKKTISETVEPEERLRLLALIESMREDDFIKTMNGVKLVLTKSIDGLDAEPFQLQFYCNTRDPVKISVNLCIIHLKGEEASIEYENEFRQNLFHSLLNTLHELI